MWNGLENHRVGRKMIAGTDDLKLKIISILRFLQKRSHKIKYFIREMHIREITAEMSRALCTHS